ncbi:MAG: hypothetical protein ABFR47_00055 [Verrucomicrobiota bacterium]
MNDFDHVLKELGELYVFNREIQRFEFVKNAPYGTTVPTGPAVVAEEPAEYKTGND